MTNTRLSMTLGLAVVSMCTGCGAANKSVGEDTCSGAHTSCDLAVELTDYRPSTVSGTKAAMESPDFSISPPG